MNKENYEWLQISEDATDEEVEASYLRLKEEYKEARWQEGAAGTYASRMLEKIQTAYEEIMAERKEKRSSAEGTSAFDEVAELIRKGDISEAQRKLDAFNERSAEWHYLQSVVFYKKNWINESKKQLEIAMQMDANNVKYRDAYTKLNARAEYQQQTGGAQNINPNPTADGEQMGGSGCASCANFCYTFLCVNCLFQMCCGCR